MKPSQQMGTAFLCYYIFKKKDTFVVYCRYFGAETLLCRHTPLANDRLLLGYKRDRPTCHKRRKTLLNTRVNRLPMLAAVIKGVRGSREG